MPIDEIEIQGSSLNLKVFQTKISDINAVFNKILTDAEKFDIENETLGFHDCQSDGTLIRGHFSLIHPFEIEHLVEGLNTRTLFKRIESCEFYANHKHIFCDGKPGPIKCLAIAFEGLTLHNCLLAEFDFDQLHQLQTRFSAFKNVVLTNPKDKEIRRARLAGQIEDYESCGIVEPQNHGIETVGGFVSTPLGEINLTVSKKGSMRLGVKKGMIINFDCLEWLIDLICEEKMPESPGLFNSGFETEV
ncbi:MAG: hypothetical protein AB1403_17435 [Candidatus Riflebacteria bacterium]